MKVLWRLKLVNQIFNIENHLFSSIGEDSGPDEIEAEGLIIWEVRGPILSHSISNQCN
jgi:hypothetical protein